MNNKTSYYFPFEIIEKNRLIPGENYYITMNHKIFNEYLNKNRNVPVSHLKGTFVKLHKENDKMSQEYAVFNNVVIMNKNYKNGSCGLMLVRYDEGFLANIDCNTFSDKNKNTIINSEREVYFSTNKWIFGRPTEEELLSTQVTSKLQPLLNYDVIDIIK